MKASTLNKIVKGVLIGAGVVVGGFLAKCVSVEDDEPNGSIAEDMVIDVTESVTEVTEEEV